MDKKLILDVGAMTFQIGQKSYNLSPSQFKILYQFFLKETIYYEDIPFGRGALKVHMVDIKKILPDGTYENIWGQGYKRSGSWEWEIAT